MEDQEEISTLVMLFMVSLQRIDSQNTNHSGGVPELQRDVHPMLVDVGH